MQFQWKQISIIILLFFNLLFLFSACKNNDQYNKVIFYNTEEVKMAHVFEDSIRETDWLKSKSFSPSGSAANYSFLYILYRVLNDINPSSIIEFGMGQTSKMTSQYAAYKNLESRLYIVEHDELWIKIFKKHILLSNNIQIVHLPLENVTIDDFKTSRYKGLKDAVGNRKFDFIILDGPLGTKRYSRTNILELLEKNLSNSFVIIIDDCNRKGEQDTIDKVTKILQEQKIQYDFTYYIGTKMQMVIYSKDYSFLKSL